MEKDIAIINALMIPHGVDAYDWIDARKAWKRIRAKLEESPTKSPNTARDAIRQAYECGYERGHNDTVESQYGDVQGKADEYIVELHP